MTAEINHFDSSNYRQNLNPAPPRRVLFVITQSEYGGAQRFLYNLISNLKREKYAIGVALGGIGASDFLEKTIKQEDVSVTRLKHLTRNPHLYNDFLTVFEIRKAIKKFKPDTLFLLSSKAGFIGSLASVFPKKIKQLKIIYRIGGWTFNDPWPKWKRSLWILLEKIGSGWKDIIIVNNQHDLDQAKEFNIKPRKGLVLIHNGIDAYKMDFLSKEEARMKLFEKLSRQSGKIFQIKKIAGTIANFYPTKGLEYLIEAAKRFKDDKEIAFFIIGDGPERQNLEARIKNLELERKVYLLGQLADGHKYLPAFDVFVLPSVKEGSPWSLIEAMSAKLPVIATGVGAVPEIIEDGKNGFVIEPKNPEQMADKIKEILDNDYLRQELGIQAHQTILFKFSLDKMVAQIKELL